MDMFGFIFVCRTMIQKTVLAVLTIVLLVNLLTTCSMRAPSQVQVQQHQAVDQVCLVLQAVAPMRLLVLAQVGKFKISMFGARWLANMLVIYNKILEWEWKISIRGSVVFTCHQLSLFEAKFVSVTVVGNGSLSHSFKL